jgi:SET domain
LIWLKGTGIYGEIESTQRQWRQEWQAALQQAGADESRYPFEDYQWACIIYTSRSFPAKIIYPDTAEGLSMLVPIIDSVNHKPQTPVHWEGTVDGAFDLRSAFNIAKGEEIFNNYGAKGNEELMFGYGFALEDNKFDIVSLKLNLGHKVKEILEERGMTNVPADSVFHISSEFPLPMNLQKVFSVIVGGTRQKENIADICGLRALQKSLSNKWFSLTSNIPEGEPANLKQQFAKFYRDGQIRILERALEAADRQLQVYEFNEKYHRISIDYIASADFNFLEGLVMAFGGHTKEDLIAQDLEDQIIVLYLIWAGVIEGPAETDQSHILEQATDLYDEIIVPLRRFDDRYSGERFEVPTLIASIKVLEENGFEYMDSQHHARYEVLLEVRKLEK